MLLEKLRFHRQETENDPGFAKKLRRWRTFFVNDAFEPPTGPMLLRGYYPFPSRGGGFLIEKELKPCGTGVQTCPPFTAVLGGPRSRQIGVIQTSWTGWTTFYARMAYTFFKREGLKVGIPCGEIYRNTAEALGCKAKRRKPGFPGSGCGFFL